MRKKSVVFPKIPKNDNVLFLLESSVEPFFAFFFVIC